MIYQLETGKVFVVLVFRDWVINIPYRGAFKKALGHSPKKNTHTLEELCDLQNRLHKDLPEYTLPCQYFGQFMISPRAKGIRKREARDEVLKIKEKALKLGYSLGDVQEPSNYIYDRGKITIIDYSHLEEV